MARVAIEEHAVAELRQQRLANGAGEIPEHVRATHDVGYGLSRAAIDLRATEVLNIEVLEREHRGMMLEPIEGDPRKKIFRYLAVAIRIVGRLDQLEPENVVTQRTQPQQELQHPR